MLTTVTPIYITGHRKPNPHHPAAAPNTTHTTHYAHHTPKMATPPPVVSNHTPTLLLPHLTYIVYTPSHLPPYTKAQSLTPRRQTCARAVSQTTVTATCPHCSYPDCTQLRPAYHTSQLHTHTQIYLHATAHTCHPTPVHPPCRNEACTIPAPPTMGDGAICAATQHPMHTVGIAPLRTDRQATYCQSCASITGTSTCQC